MLKYIFIGLFFVLANSPTSFADSSTLDKNQCMVHKGTQDIVCCSVGQLMTFYQKAGNAVLIEYKSFMYKDFRILIPPQKNLIGGCRLEQTVKVSN